MGARRQTRKRFFGFSSSTFTKFARANAALACSTHSGVTCHARTRCEAPNDFHPPEYRTVTAETNVGYLAAVAVTPDGAQAISTSRDTTLKVWDLKTGQVVRTFRRVNWIGDLG